MTDDLATQLQASPYLLASDTEAQHRLAAAQASASNTRKRASAAKKAIRQRAKGVLTPYSQATRADLVTESNRIEGYVWDPSAVRSAIAQNLNTLRGSEFALTQLVRSDKKLYEVLGLYRAHEIADSWRSIKFTPGSSHIREFHRLILGDRPGSGQFKTTTNSIAGREDHQTTLPIDVPREMSRLVDWWAGSTGDPLLTATVVHAWLAHIHPFSDGNGRLARVLANLELTRHDYAPLVISSEADRGEYYTALEESDGGNILPLYELFERVIRRQTDLMSQASYVEDLLANQLLANQKARYDMWSAGTSVFAQELARQIAQRRGHFKLEGDLGLASFSLLWNADKAGNGWFATIGAHGRGPEWLLWFGYKTDDWLARNKQRRDFPSIHVSRRDNSPGAPHPFRWDYPHFPGRENVPDEIRLALSKDEAIQFRYNSSFSEYNFAEGASHLLDALEAGVQDGNRR